MDTDEILRNVLLIIAALCGLALVVRRPREPLGPLALLATAVGAVGATLAAAGLHALVSWPEDLLAVGLGAAILIPLGLLAGTSRWLAAAIDPLLLRTISFAGLTLVVVAVYLGVVLGLGRVPRQD